MTVPWMADLDRDGIVSVPNVLPTPAVDDLIRHLSPLVGSGAGDRRLHEDELVRRFVTQGPMGSLARTVLGKPLVARVLFFDKLAGANWKVPYHQDVTIAVRERHEVAGFSGWSEKAGMTHVRAPASVLEQMIAVRLHLDDCGFENGPLRAVPGSHRMGVLPKASVSEIIEEQGEQIYTSKAGGAILMRPLILHASSAAISVSHRRVLHVEYAATALPGGLDWALGFEVVET